MRPLPHGYTNETIGDAATVVKKYAGPDAVLRAGREYAALVAMPGRVFWGWLADVFGVRPMYGRCRSK